MIQRVHALYTTYTRDLFAAYWMSITAVVGALVLLVLFVDPAPPNHIEIATGADEDACRSFVQQGLSPAAINAAEQAAAIKVASEPAA